MPDELAQKRAWVIMQVRGGKMTAAEGAQQLGVSRNTYYEWEKKGLSGMMEALLDKEPGRPASPEPDPEKEAVKRRLAGLEKELCVARESIHVRRVLDMYEEKLAKDARHGGKKNRNEAGCGNGHREPHRICQNADRIALSTPLQCNGYSFAQVQALEKKKEKRTTAFMRSRSRQERAF